MGYNSGGSIVNSFDNGELDWQSFIDAYFSWCTANRVRPAPNVTPEDDGVRTLITKVGGSVSKEAPHRILGLRWRRDDDPPFRIEDWVRGNFGAQ